MYAFYWMSSFLSFCLLRVTMSGSGVEKDDMVKTTKSAIGVWKSSE